MAIHNFQTFYFSKNTGQTANPYRYDVIDLPSGDRAIKVYGQVSLVGQGLVPQLFDFIIYHQAWMAQYQIGSNAFVRTQQVPTFEQFVLDVRRTL